MAGSLRRILGKRPLSTTPSPENADDSPQHRPFLAPSTLKSEESMKLSDSSVPAPPPPTLQRKTPSKEKLNKYKRNAPVSKFSTPSRAINQGEIGELTPEASSSHHHSSPTRRIEAQGCEFDVMASKDAIENVPDASRTPTGLAPSRSTRSQRRRHERSDSTHEDDALNTKDFASATAFGGTSKDSTLQVPGLNLGRKKDTRSPSPSTPRTSSNSPPSPASTVLRHSPTPNYLIDRCKNNNADNNNSSPYNSTPDTISPYIESSPNIIPVTTSPTPGTAHIETVKVRPPIYDLLKTPGQQWEQYGITSSRPERAWEPCPRWSCCICGAQTIVEQIVCARLDCGHDRCHNRCSVRAVNQRVGIFGRM